VIEYPEGGGLGTAFLKQGVVSMGHATCSATAFEWNYWLSIAGFPFLCKRKGTYAHRHREGH
jgi:hypothetical protein